MIIIPFVLQLFSNFCSLHAQISPNISLGSSITAGSNISWRSLSGDYAFGFYPLHKGLHLLGIWFDKIPEKTLVWSANRDRPAEPNSSIQLNGAGELVIEYVNGSTQQLHSASGACNDPPTMTQYCPLLAPHIRLPRRSPILGLLSQRLA